MLHKQKLVSGIVGNHTSQDDATYGGAKKEKSEKNKQKKRKARLTAKKYQYLSYIKLFKKFKEEFSKHCNDLLWRQSCSFTSKGPFPKCQHQVWGELSKTNWKWKFAINATQEP